MDITNAYRMCLWAAVLGLLITICVDYCVYITCLIVLHITYTCMEKRCKTLLPVNRKAVPITGCDTGFGHQLANRLVDHGFVVFAGVLKINGEGADKLRNRNLSNLHVLQLNVNSTNDIKEAVSTVKTITDTQGLWGVVNNAGFAIPGDIELVKLSQYRRVIETNLYGQISIIKAFLPLLRQTKGRIVNVSSVRGRFSWPGYSTYQISKYGVETMSDSLRLEMVKFGVKVSLIEPGRYGGATSVASPEMCEKVKEECDEMWEDASLDTRETYGKRYIYLPYERIKGFNPVAVSPNPVLDAFEDALLNTRPKPRYLIAGGNGLYDPFSTLARVYNFFPEYITDLWLMSYTGCHKPLQNTTCN